VTVPASPYAPGTLGDEPAAPRAPGRALPFVLASFVTALIGPGVFWLSWPELLLAARIAAPGTWPLFLLLCAPAALALGWAFLSDRWSLMDTRRDGHLFFAVLLAGSSWLAFLVPPLGPLRLVAGFGIVAAHSIAGVAIGGALVEIGRRQGTTGGLAAAWVAMLVAASLVGIPLEGTAPGPLKAGLSVGVAAIVAIAIITLAGTGPAPSPATPPSPSLGAYLRSRALWATAGVVLLAMFASIPYAVVDRGAWPPSLRGAMLGGQIVACGVYAFSCRRVSLARGLRLALVLNAVATMGLMPVWERIGAALPLAVVALGLVEGFKFATLTDLALRASPPRHEAFVGALLTAVSGLAWQARGFFAEASGVPVFDAATLVGGASVLAVFACGLLPASLVASRDGVVTPPMSGGPPP
jgi:hypothetical protein